MDKFSAKKHTLLIGLLIGLPLICIAGFGFFFVRMYQHDMQTLTGFMVSYQAYDQAVATASASIFTANGNGTSDASAEERQADSALSNLKSISSVQMSSLIKNEVEAMRVMQEIAELADKEMSTLKTYQQTTPQDVNRDTLAQTFHELTQERQAAFADFQGLGR